MPPSKAVLRSGFLIVVGVILGLATFPNLAQTPGAVAVRLEIQMVGGEPLGESTGQLVLTPVVGASEEILLPVQAAHEISLPENSAWQVRLEAPGFWAPEEPLLIKSEERKVQRVSVWRTGMVTGLIESDSAKGVNLQQPVWIEFEAPPLSVREVVIPVGSRVGCSVADEGRFSCEVPSGLFDVSIRTEGFAAHYAWSTEVPVGKTISIGRIRLRKGASVSGWIDAEPGAKLERATVRIYPRVAPGSRDLAVRRTQRAGTKTRVDDRGFFQLSGVAPGTYVVEVEHPEFARSTIFPVEVWTDRESSLSRPIVLQRPIQLTLQADPALDPTGAPWMLTMRRGSDQGTHSAPEALYEGAMPETGLVEIANQAPGSFDIEVSTRQGDRYFHAVEVKLGGDHPEYYRIEIPWVEVYGKVLLGEEGIPAQIWFGGQHGARRVALESDPHGEFAGVLPRSGNWRVEVHSQDADLKTKLSVQVGDEAEPSTRGPYWVDLLIPNTEIAGEVHDAAGQLVSNAEVSLQTRNGTVRKVSDEEGRFSFRGLPAETVSLSAKAMIESQPQISRPRVVVLSEDMASNDIVLRLEGKKAVSGTIRSLVGPIAGAKALVFPASFFGATQETTGLDGRFSALVPESERTAYVAIAPPGHSLKAFEVPLHGDQLEFLVTRDGGTLEVAIDLAPEQYSATEQALLFFQNEVPIPRGFVLRWAIGRGVDFPDDRLFFSIPAMAPGRYRVCMKPREVIAGDQLPAWVASATCAEGDLFSGGVLRLELGEASTEGVAGH